MPLPHRRVASIAAIVAISAACVSCRPDDHVYVIETAPVDSGVERHVTVFRIKDSDSTKTPVAPHLYTTEADRLEQAYGARPDTLRIYSARGRFPDIPDDVGNHGTLRHYGSALGRAWNYTELIGGDRDPLAGVEAALGAADSLADMGIDWLQSELGGHPKWPALHSYLDRDARRAIRNCALRVRRPDPLAWDQNAFAVATRPLILSLLLGGVGYGGGDLESRIYDGAFLADARDAMATILGLESPKEIEATLRFMSEPDSIDLRVARYTASKSGMTTEEVIGRRDLLSALILHGALLDEEASDSDSVEVRLAVHPGRVGLDTNGDWDDELQRVVWHGRVRLLGGGGSGGLLNCYASWAVPDAVAQRRLFGRVLLDDTNLFQYCVWFDSLDDRRREEWNRMLRRLKPGNRKALERFEFSDGKGKRTGDEIPGRELILDVLEPGRELIPKAPE